MTEKKKRMGRTYVIQNGGEKDAWLCEKREEEQKLVYDGWVRDSDLSGRPRRKKGRTDGERIKQTVWVYRKDITQAKRYDDLWEAWVDAAKVHGKVWHIVQNSVQEPVTEAEVIEAMKRNRKEEYKNIVRTQKQNGVDK